MIALTRLGSGLLAVIFLPVLCAGGCGHAEYSGFLYPYDNFKKISMTRPDLEYVRPDVAWGKYHKIRIAQVVTYVQPTDGEYRAVDPDDLKRMTDYLEDMLVEAFGKKLEITQQAGPDVLDLKAALTRVRPTSRAATGNVPPIKMVGAMITAAARPKRVTFNAAGPSCKRWYMNTYA